MKGTIIAAAIGAVLTIYGTASYMAPHVPEDKASTITSEEFFESRGAHRSQIGKPATLTPDERTRIAETEVFIQKTMKELGIEPAVQPANEPVQSIAIIIVP